jgi:hypothetical protein
MMHNSFKATDNTVVVGVAPFWFTAVPSVAEAKCAAISAQRALSPCDRLGDAISVAQFRSNGMAGAGVAREKGRSCAPEPVGFP